MDGMVVKLQRIKVTTCIKLTIAEDSCMALVSHFKEVAKGKLVKRREKTEHYPFCFKWLSRYLKCACVTSCLKKLLDRCSIFK